MKKGKFYAVGVGPGDGGYMTLKGYSVLNKVNTVAVPVTSADENSVALSIAEKNVDMSEKNILTLVFSMNKDVNIREEERKKATYLVKTSLDEGNDVAMVMLGDVTVYSTGAYILEYLNKNGYETEMISGVTSFSAGAAMAGVSLCQGDETLAVVPSAKMSDKIEKALDNFDNIVIMKAGRKIKQLEQLIKQKGLIQNTIVISNIGLDGEYIGSLDDREYGYFTTLIIKKGHIIS